MFDWSHWNKNMADFGQSDMPFGSSRPSSSPASGDSKVSLGASSTPAFGSPSSSLFDGSFSIGLKCVTCGGFERVPHITHPTFGSNLFGSTQPFGGSSKPAYGVFNTPASSGSFRISLKCATCGGFEWISQITQLAFGSNLFGSTQPFGGSSQPAFDASNTSTSSGFEWVSQITQPAFGSNLFGSTQPFGGSSQPAFDASNTSASSGSFRIGLKCVTCGGFECVPQITQPTFGSNPFGSTRLFGGSS